MTSAEWLERYIKLHQPVTPAATYEAAKQAGFTRQDIKKARHWHGKLINTQECDGKTLWRWDW